MRFEGKIKSALFYPAIVIVIATVVVAIIMWFVIPSFKQVFTSFGAEFAVVDQRRCDVRLVCEILVRRGAIIPVAAFMILVYLWKRMPGI